MKPTLLVILLIVKITFEVSGQSGSLLDARDGHRYKTTNIGTTSWMIENLVYETSMSVSLNDFDKSKHNLSDVEARYYPFQELDSVCPSGWDLPTFQDWNDYFNFIRTGQNVDMEFGIEDKPHHHFILGYGGQIDLFAEGNPLSLKPLGRYEGILFSTSIDTPFADYWSKDDVEEYPGTTHVHLMNPWTTIHSHKHNMKPKQKEKFRRFMVRCVQHNP